MSESLMELRRDTMQQLTMLTEIAPAGWETYLRGVSKRVKRAVNKNDLDTLGAINTEVRLRVNSAGRDAALEVFASIVNTLLRVTGIIKEQSNG